MKVIPPIRGIFSYKNCFIIVLDVFSACGGIRTGSRKPALTAYFPMLAYGILGKGGLFVIPSLENCLTGLTGSSTRAGTDCTDLQLIGSSVADCFYYCYFKKKI